MYFKISFSLLGDCLYIYMCAYVNVCIYTNTHTLIELYLFKHTNFRMVCGHLFFQKAKIILVAFLEHPGISKTILRGVENGNQHMRRHFGGDFFLVMKSWALPDPPQCHADTCVYPLCKTSMDALPREGLPLRHFADISPNTSCQWLVFHTIRDAWKKLSPSF